MWSLDGTHLSEPEAEPISRDWQPCADPQSIPEISQDQQDQDQAKWSKSATTRPLEITYNPIVSKVLFTCS